MNQYKIGNRIKILRLKKGLSINKLSSISNISKSYLSNIESHKINPSALMVKKLSNALEVPVEQLLNLKLEQLDPEWVALLQQAKKMGINKEDIRDFLTYEKWRQNSKEK